MQDVLTLILGGGRGASLYPLTKQRSEPAVPLAGKYRLIDVPISNSLNSGLNRIYVLTQFLSVSLHRHIASTYKIDPFHHGFVEVLAAQQTNETADWYQGTADALRQNLRYVPIENTSDILVLSGDQLYRMDFQPLLQAHRERRAAVTIAAVPVGRDRVPGLGVLRLGDDERVIDLVEKPRTEEELDRVRTPGAWLEGRGVRAAGREYLANMGIYLFQRAALFQLLEAYPTAMDLVRELLAPSLATQRVQVYLFDGYWEDLGTIRSYHAAHLALAGDQPPFDFHGPEGVIYTHMRYLPASRVQAATVEQCLISDGCTIGPGARLERSVIGLRGRIGRDVSLREAVLLGADFYETDGQFADNRRQGLPDVGIGDGTVITRAIVDKNCRIGRGVRIVNHQNLSHGEGDLFVIRDGIVVLPKGTVVPDGTVI
jgi:glucose-1-phosphate adenylyltransferase